MDIIEENYSLITTLIENLYDNQVTVSIIPSHNMCMTVTRNRVVLKPIYTTFNIEIHDNKQHFAFEAVAYKNEKFVTAVSYTENGIELKRTHNRAYYETINSNLNRLLHSFRDDFSESNKEIAA